MSKRREHGPVQRAPAERTSVGRNGLYVKPDDSAAAFKLIDDKRADNKFTPYSGKGRKVSPMSEKEASAQLIQLLGGLVRPEDRSSEGVASPAVGSFSKEAGWFDDLIGWLQANYGGDANSWFTKLLNVFSGQPQTEDEQQAQVQVQDQQQQQQQQQEQAPQAPIKNPNRVSHLLPEAPQDVRDALDSARISFMKDENGQYTLDPETGQLATMSHLQGVPLFDTALSNLGLSEEGDITQAMRKQVPWIQKGLGDVGGWFGNQVMGLPGAGLERLGVDGAGQWGKRFGQEAGETLGSLADPRAAENLAIPAANSIGGDVASGLLGLGARSMPFIQTAENLAAPVMGYLDRDRDLGRMGQMQAAINKNPEYFATPDGQNVLRTYLNSYDSANYPQFRGQGDPTAQLDPTKAIQQQMYNRAIDPTMNSVMLNTDSAETAGRTGAMQALQNTFSGLEKYRLGAAAPYVALAENAITVGDWLNRARVAQQYDPTASYGDALRDVVHRQGDLNARNAMGPNGTPRAQQMWNSFQLGIQDQAGTAAAIASLHDQAWREHQKARQSQANVAVMQNKVEQGWEAQRQANFNKAQEQMRQKGEYFKPGKTLSDTPIFDSYQKVPYSYKQKYTNWMDHVKSTPEDAKAWQADLEATRKRSPEYAKFMETGQGQEYDPYKELSWFDKAVGWTIGAPTSMDSRK